LSAISLILFASLARSLRASLNDGLQSALGRHSLKIADSGEIVNARTDLCLGRIASLIVKEPHIRIASWLMLVISLRDTAT
jgi:hypothetical protein